MPWAPPDEMPLSRATGRICLAITGPLSRNIILGLRRLFAGTCLIGCDNRTRARANAD
jgi:hypothetical protein